MILEFVWWSLVPFLVQIMKKLVNSEHFQRYLSRLAGDGRSIITSIIRHSSSSQTAVISIWFIAYRYNSIICFKISSISETWWLCRWLCNIKLWTNQMYLQIIVYLASRVSRTVGAYAFNCDICCDICMYIGLCMYIYMYVCVYACMHACVYACIVVCIPYVTLCRYRNELLIKNINLDVTLPQSGRWIRKWAFLSLLL